jgi:hypothetical protein
MSAALKTIDRPAARSKLKAVDPKAAEPSKPKILIFGKPGVGKTWAALDFPAVYYIDTEGGADLDHYTDKLKASGGMYLGLDQGSLDFETIIEQVQALATEKHQFKTLVIDSVSKVFNQAVADAAADLGDKNAFGADKKVAIGYMRRLISWLIRIDMNVILIAHEKDLWGKTDKGDREVVGATFDAWDKLEYELHLCLNIYKQGPSRKARVTKSRLTGFPDADVMPWSFDEFARRYGRDVINKESTQIVLASPEQVAEIARLLKVVKVPDGWEEKCFSAAGIASWDEMDAEKIEKSLTYLKDRLS